MRRIEKILVAVMVMLLLGSEYAYAWKGMSSPYDRLKRTSSGIYNWGKRNFYERARTGVYQPAFKAGKATVKFVRKNPAVLAGPAGLAVKYGVKYGVKASRSAVKYGAKIGNFARNNSTAIAAGAGATIGGGPVIGAAVGAGVAAGKSKLFRGWVTNTFGGNKKQLQRISMAGSLGAGLGMTSKIKIEKIDISK